jgi:hypothetical protein
MSEVRIVTRIEEDNWYGEQVNQEFYVDGELVGTGWYGGEPEDNTWSRSYAWVDEVIAKIAVKLGADVVTEIHEPDED